jgi:hypothetical protein
VKLFQKVFLNFAQIACTFVYIQVGAQSFIDVAPQMGISHTVNTNMSIGGSGVNFFDFDNDGWDDLTFVQVNDSLAFYKNVNGTFVKLPSFVYGDGEVKHLLWVDYDNDGDYDAFLVPHAKPCKLFRNEGDFTFTDVTFESGLFGLNSNNHGVSFGDYDRDGYLDFYLCRYDNSQNADPLNPLQNNALYRNNGDGTFTNVTIEAGVANGTQPSFQGIWIDVNRNGWPDLYVVNDRLLWGNTLYLNNGDGTFTDYTEQSGLSMFGEDPMSATFADYDNDGDLDILCTNGGVPTKPIRVYQNQGDTTFLEIGQQLGINVNVTFHCTWGATWLDVENTGFMDLYVTTGLLTLNPDNEIRSYLFMSDSATSFIDSPSLFQGSNHIAASYSVAKGDINNDGFADLVVQNAKNFNSFIWENQVNPENENSYLKVTLQGTVSNTMAIGSWITVYTNGKQYTHYTRCGENFVSQDSQHYIFGLGNASVVDSLVVEYSLGHIDVYYDVEVNQHLYLKEGETISVFISPVGNTTEACLLDSVVLDAGQWTNYLWNTGHNGQFLSVNEPGDYWVHVTNEFGFTASSDTVHVEFFPQPIIDYQVTQPSCHNDSNGMIEVENVLGIPASEVTWNNGMTGETIEGLVAGTYTYLFTDENGCSTEGEILVQQPFPLSVQIFTSPEISGNDGSIILIINGGTPQYTITINGEPAGMQTTNLAAGQYSLEVVDANGCSFEAQVFIDFTSSVLNIQIPLHRVFPNPVNSGDQIDVALSVDRSRAELQIHDLTGRQVYNGNFDFQRNVSVPVSMPYIPAGVYIIRVWSDNEMVLSEKLVVQ